MTERKNWTREEHIIAFNLYCKIPFSKLTKSHPQIIDLSKRLGRTPSSVSMKLCNFARLDPALKARNIKGLSQGAKGEEEVWNEFHGNWEDLAWQSELLLAKYENDEIIKSSDIDYSDLAIEGKEREAVIQARVNQSFFRKMILSSYNYTCAITGIQIPELLVASHIIPWKDRKETRKIFLENKCSLQPTYTKKKLTGRFSGTVLIFPCRFRFCFMKRSVSICKRAGVGKVSGA
jgi:putative restriction endonuclease